MNEVWFRLCRVAPGLGACLVALASPTRAQAGPWTAHSIAADGDGLQLDAGDIDGDGDPDVVSGSRWSENIAAGTSWSAHSCGLFDAEHALDLDGDGDLDVFGFGGSLAAAELSWGENVSADGALMVQRRIASLGHGPLALDTTAADVDLDGDLDALVVTGAGELDWYENANGAASIWLAHTVAPPDSAQSLAVADVDGDGDPDLFTGSAYDYSWQENVLGNGLSWTPHVINVLGSYTGRIVSAADVDGDGAVDALYSSSQFLGPIAVGWLRNSGSGISWALHSVHGELGANPMSMRLLGVDLDRDGDTDLVEFRAVQPVWYERTGGTWSVHFIAGASVSSGVVVDLDLDGDRDIVGSSGPIDWRENLTPVSPYGRDVNPPRSLALLDGAPSLGQRLTFGLDNPRGTQASGAHVFLALATEPQLGFPSGRLIPRWGMAGPGAAGELLVSLAGANPVEILAVPDWSGPGIPSRIALDVPANPLLVGMTVYLQGLLVDRSAAHGVRFGLTNALRLEIGP